MEKDNELNKIPEKTLKESEVKYRTIFENTGTAFMIIEEDMTISLINGEVEKTFGYLKEDVEGKKKWTEFVASDEDRKKMAEYHMLRRENPESAPKKYEFHALHKNGNIKDVLVAVSVIPGTKQSIASFLDITDIKKTESALIKSEKELKEAHENLEHKVQERTKELKKSNEQLKKEIEERKKAEEKIIRLANIVESSDDAIASLTLDGIVTSWNKGAEKVYGYSAGEMIGKGPYAILNPSQWEKVSENIEKIKKGEKIVYYEAKRHKKDDKEIYVSVKLSPIKNSKGNITGISLISRDITDRKKAEEKLHKTIKELERSNYELQQFAYITSHDLQEPLRTIASFTQLLERRYKDKLDKDADEFIDFVVDAAVRMKEMIQDLLNYSRIGSNYGELKLINANKALNNAIHNLKSSIGENNAVITHDPLPTVTADKGLLTQLFQNLIGNAIKFRKRDVPPRIHISASLDEKNNEYIFKVSDNGIGMEEQYTDKIFEVFKRLHTMDEYRGTGIGLAISKKIVERHSGRIWVESILGKGSTFYFTLTKP